MPDTLRNYLELIRLPGVFTAHADIVAGFLMAGAGIEDIGTLLCLLGASSCFFSAGMALNDFFDADIDRIERPERPIPSGRISRHAALTLGLSLLALGLFFALLAGTKHFLIGLSLTAVILLYDGVFKSNPVLGPLFMSSCRYFNLLMALAVQPFDGWTLVPCITFIYIFGVTVLSRKEAEGGNATAHIGVSALAIGLSCVWGFLLFLKGVLPNITGILLLIGFAVLLSERVLHLLENHRPEKIQNTMKILLIALLALNFILASTRIPVYLSALILTLYIPAVGSVRFFKVT